VPGLYLARTRAFFPEQNDYLHGSFDCDSSLLLGRMIRHRSTAIHWFEASMSLLVYVCVHVRLCVMKQPGCSLMRMIS
jgi:hypothetical protein